MPIMFCGFAHSLPLLIFIFTLWIKSTAFGAHIFWRDHFVDRASCPDSQHSWQLFVLLANQVYLEPDQSNGTVAHLSVHVSRIVRLVHTHCTQILGCLVCTGVHFKQHCHLEKCPKIRRQKPVVAAGWVICVLASEESLRLLSRPGNGCSVRVCAWACVCVSVCVSGGDWPPRFGIIYLHWADFIPLPVWQVPC